MVWNLKIYLAIFLICGLSIGTVIHVPSEQPTIQDGLNAASEGDTVLVAPGIYYENIVWPSTQGIHLISELGRDLTIIDGDSTNRVIEISTWIDTTTVIRGFTIQNGRSAFGAGIYCDSASSPVIANNTIASNTAIHPLGAAGGGIFCSHSSPIISGNIITNNMVVGWSVGGGGICCDHSSPIISGNTITLNVLDAQWDAAGGGIYCIYSSPTITGNTISNNEGGAGGGIFCRVSSPTIDNCTIAYNDDYGVDCRHGSEPAIHYCDIFDNSGYGIHNNDVGVVVDADSNWWGHLTGPYHPTANPNGLGEEVSDYVDFDPWLSWPVGVEEQPIVKPIETQEIPTATIFHGPLQLPEGKECKVFDIMGRFVEPDKIKPGIYFIEVDGVVTQKVVKVR